MHIKHFLSCLLLLYPLIHYGQPEAVETVKGMSQGMKNALRIELPTDDHKLIGKMWEKTLKDFKGKTKYNRKTKEWFTDDVHIGALSANTVDVYARADQRELLVWFDLGGAYLSADTHPDEFAHAQRLLQDFHHRLEVALAEDALERQEKQFKNLQSELKKLEKQNKELHQTIEKAKKAIAEAEKGIEENLKAQEAKKAELDKQAQSVDTAKKQLTTLKRKN